MKHLLVLLSIWSSTFEFDLVTAIATGNPRKVATTTVTTWRSATSNLLLEPWKEYDFLRDSNLEEEILEPFFAARPQTVARRLWQVSSTLLRARRDWTATNDGSRLCESVSSLGPVAVKVGQTLSQRPDIVGKEAAIELQRLQTKNAQFDNALAYAILEECLGSDSIAPGIGSGSSDSTKRPVFASMSPDPIACASLGQVYKAVTHDGRNVAVKVQRPDAMAILALDTQCFRVVFRSRSWIQRWQKKLRNAEEEAGTDEEVRGKQNVGSVIDRVARDIKGELDYTLEAANNNEFRESLAFLGFVTTPSLVPEYTSERVLVTEWIPGHHLEDLEVEEGLTMARMAVEACTASLVLTGLVHADPHEGNLMLHEDGRVVFLDFGLMSRVEQNIMEGFARGIQALLSEDWLALSEAFVDVGFVTNPIMHREGINDKWREDPNYGVNELSQELAEAMESTEGGKARFGALAEVLNKKISPRWLVFTPPFVLLLIRTFLTLEGIAAKLDPDFNIYEMAMPWAVRRSLSPSTQKGIEVLRSTLLTPDNRIQWARFLELTVKGDDSENNVVSEARMSTKQARQEAAKKAAMNDAVGSLLGSTEGKALRRTLRDLDTVDLITKLSSEDGLPVLRKAARVAASKIVTFAKKGAVDEDKPGKSIRPVSEESMKLKEKHARWKKKVTWILIWGHAKRQVGYRGIVNVFRLSWRFTRFCIYATGKALHKKFLISKKDVTSSPPVIVSG